MPDLSPRHYEEINPKTIVVRRDSRQRTEEPPPDPDLRESIRNLGIIVPLIVRNSADGAIELVAGERRLREALTLELPLVPIIHFESLPPLKARVIELEENIKRWDLPWRDKVRAIGEIHRLHKEEDPTWTIDQTSAACAVKAAIYLQVYGALDSPKLEGATSVQHAFGILQRLADRRAEAIVSDIISGSTNAFTPPPPIHPPPGYGNSVLNGAQSTAGEGSSGDDVSFDVGDSTDVAGADPPPRIGDSPPPGPPAPPVATIPAPIQPPAPIVCANFLDWAPQYAGPRFNLIHCDFPYGVRFQGNVNRAAGTRFGSTHAQVFNETEGELYENTTELYWALTECLTSNLHRLMSHSAHLMFWFSMKYYTETVTRLRIAGLMVHDHPLIWHKTDGRGIAPSQNIYPKRTYDTALLASLGNRSLVKQNNNSYGAPTVNDPTHPSQKPEPMLRHFMSMLVDETTTVLDPTCGSGSAIRAAEDLGARSVLGLEINETHAADALRLTNKARILRQAGR